VYALFTYDATHEQQLGEGEIANAPHARTAEAPDALPDYARPVRPDEGMEAFDSDRSAT
jgi:hypothetical protein